MTKIVIADDHPLILESLKELLFSNYPEWVINTATKWSDTISIIKPDTCLLIADLDMPCGDAQTSLQILRREYPNLKIIILTMHTESWIIRKLKHACIDAYVSKNSDSSEIIHAIEAIKSGNRYFCKEFDEINPNKPKTIPTDFDLTPREKEVLNLIAESRTTKEIASLLSVSINTVESHRKNLFVKFDVANVVGLVVKAINNGVV
ncbi:MAG: response regulator transcription factor [Bacteroidales bacterium]|nr:response regulator transcription factor [Bacteroidales bacterium]